MAQSCKSRRVVCPLAHPPPSRRPSLAALPDLHASGRDRSPATSFLRPRSETKLVSQSTARADRRTKIQAAASRCAGTRPHVPALAASAGAVRRLNPGAPQTRRTPRQDSAGPARCNRFHRPHRLAANHENSKSGTCCGLVLPRHCCPAARHTPSKETGYPSPRDRTARSAG